MARNHQAKEHNPDPEAYTELLCGGGTKAYLSIRPPWISTLVSAGLTAHDRDDRIEQEKACLALVRPLTPFSTDDELWDWLVSKGPFPGSLTYDQLERLICERFQWDKLVEDPWNNQAAFDKWLNCTIDTIQSYPTILRYLQEQLIIWAINETHGRDYYIQRILSQPQIRKLEDKKEASKLSEETLINWIGTGCEQWLAVKKYSGQRKFGYPHKPLPMDFMIRQIIMKEGAFSPYSLYLTTLKETYLGYAALKELTSRLVKHPEGTAFLKYVSATDEETQTWNRAIQDPESYEPPTMDEAFEDMDEAMKGSLLQVVEKSLHNIHGSEVELGMGYVGEGYPEVQESLYKRLNEFKRREIPENPLDQTQLEKDVLAAIGGYLDKTIMAAVWNDYHDSVKSSDKAFRNRHENAKAIEKPTTKIERIDIAERMRDETPECEKLPLSLDIQIKQDDKTARTFLDFVEDRQSEQSFNKFDRNEMIHILLNQTKLTDQEKFVIDQRLKDMTDENIARRLAKQTGKTTSPDNVRKIHSRATKKVKEAANLLSLDDREVILSLLS